MTLRGKFNGAKIYTEAWACTLWYRGRGASYEGRSHSVSDGGLHTSENAGMSSENYVRIIMAESLRFLEEGSSAPSKSEAKVRRKRVADAQTVEIPLPQKDLSKGTH